MATASTTATTRSEFADAVTVLFLAAAALVVTALRRGIRLQQERDALEKETEGLV